MRIALGADHRGLALKQYLCRRLKRQGHRLLDCGTDSTEPVDYPDIAQKVAGAVAARRAGRGILICASGIGMTIAANRFRGVRAALVCDLRRARLARQHNDANILCLGADYIQPAQAAKIVRVWLLTPFAGGRHRRRVKKLDRLTETSSRKKSPASPRSWRPESPPTK